MNIKTERLILRQWQAEDLEAFALLNSDPRVMEHFPSLLTKEQSDALVARFTELIQNNGWGFWTATLFNQTQ